MSPAGHARSGRQAWDLRRLPWMGSWKVAGTGAPLLVSVTVSALAAIATCSASGVLSAVYTVAPIASMAGGERACGLYRTPVDVCYAV
jgi:hypothetical protein